VVIDEVHYVKQRRETATSRRSNVLMRLLVDLAQRYDDVAVLGMSATPVINDLVEGKTLIEMVTGERHDDLDTKATVSNCLALHKKLMNNGIRYVPAYETALATHTEYIPCPGILPEVKALPKRGLPQQKHFLYARRCRIYASI